MKCQKCGAENEDGGRYCCFCGEPIAESNCCPSCGKQSEGGRYCIYCGTEIASAVNRKENLYATQNDINYATNEYVPQAPQVDFSERNSVLRRNLIMRLIFMGICVLVAIGGGLLGGFAQGLIGSLLSLLMISAGVGGFLLWVPLGLLSDRKRIKRSYCSACGEKYDFNYDIACELSDVYTTSKWQTAKINFACRCSNCYRISYFSTTFKTAEVDQFGHVNSVNLEHQARKYFVQ